MKQWFTVKNDASQEAAEILIYDQIGKDWWTGEGTAAKDFAEALKTIPRGRSISVRINSPGGNVADGLAIYNQLQARSQDVVVTVDGYAASIASVIALGGRELRMPRNALFMVHNPSAMVQGTSEDMRHAAEVLDAHAESIASVYQKKTKKPMAEIKKLMTDETWLTGDGAKEHGYADVVTDAIEITASFDLSKFKHPPSIDSKKPYMNLGEFKNLFGQLLGFTPPTAQPVATVTESPVKNVEQGVGFRLEELDTARAELVTARQSIQSLTSERDTAVTAIRTLKVTHAADIEKIKADHATELSQAKKPSSQAITIAASQGVPNPVPQSSEETATSTAGGIVDQWMAIKDPAEKTAFYRKHKAAIRSAGNHLRT